MASVKAHLARQILDHARTGLSVVGNYGDSTMAIGLGRVAGLERVLFDTLTEPFDCWGLGPITRGGYRTVREWLAFITPTTGGGRDIFVADSADVSLPSFLTDIIPPNLTALSPSPINGGYLVLHDGEVADWNNMIGPRYANGNDAPAWLDLVTQDIEFHFSFLELTASSTPEAHFNIRMKEGGTTILNDFYADGNFYGPGEGDPAEHGHVCGGLGANAWKHGYFDLPAGSFTHPATGNGIGPGGRQEGSGQNEAQGIAGVVAYRDFVVKFPEKTAGIMVDEHYIGGGLDATECEADLAAYDSTAFNDHYANILRLGGAGTKFLIILGMGENDASAAAMLTAYRAQIDRIIAMFAAIGVPVLDYTIACVSCHDWASFPEHGFRTEVCSTVANEYDRVCHIDPTDWVSEADIAAVNGFEGDSATYAAHLVEAGELVNIGGWVEGLLLVEDPPSGGGNGIGGNLGQSGHDYYVPH